MNSITYGEVNINDVAKIISRNVKEGQEYNLYIGTDSMSRYDTKMVMVIALHHVGHGGIFFYDIIHVRRMYSIKQKLMKETELSISLADQLKKAFEKLYDETGFDYTSLHMKIHVDAGEDGKSSQVISEISNYITAYGYEFTIKPDSYAASTIANKISK